ncbi:GNAT family N-acetyltransferase [Tersicoccus sp. Bi-70]|uniref:GNAT family N-acetyltransferase n=1 Tax=Tersicoccus sp. Bi-70 TaxID=1897634 RepID=UPI000977AF81|nr:GNAT family N-acetyltransferase [Tersicoccus sp. Bi-70]OMH36816.1 hypothetical protein BGP79_13710 [Tersicoccus sp. Bi-70]
MLIRRAEPEDVASIAPLLRGSSLASVEEALADPDRLVLVAQAPDGDVVGWAKTHHWHHDDPPAPAGHYLGGVTVAESWRRQGIAVALTEHRMAWLEARTDVVWCVTNARNVASLALHAGLGFDEVTRGARFHTTTFDGGVGVLLCARLGLRAGTTAPVDTLAP